MHHAPGEILHPLLVGQLPPRLAEELPDLSRQGILLLHLLGALAGVSTGHAVVEGWEEGGAEHALSRGAGVGGVVGGREIQSQLLEIGAQLSGARFAVGGGRIGDAAIDVYGSGGGGGRRRTWMCVTGPSGEAEIVLGYCGIRRGQNARPHTGSGAVGRHSLQRTDESPFLACGGLLAWENGKGFGGGEERERKVRVAATAATSSAQKSSLFFPHVRSGNRTGSCCGWAASAACCCCCCWSARADQVSTVPTVCRSLALIFFFLPTSSLFRSSQN